jgi:hypothetical protein
MRRIVHILASCSFLLGLGFSFAHAGWVPNGVAVAPVPDPVPGAPQIVSDGSGGAIVAWQNSGASGKDIYAQRVDASGAVLWEADGIVVCAAAYDQMNPRLIADGSGGAIIAWEDGRGGNYDIYAHRVDASGVVQWAANGVGICLAANNQESSRIVSDGSGGAIITWEDYRGGNYDIYAQRVAASGVVQWTADGVAVCMAASAQSLPEIGSDGSGGAVIAWQDYRGGTSDIYVQRLNGSGAALWTTDGVPLCTAGNNQSYPMISSDGSGGAIIAWQDYRYGNTDIYAGRVDGSGTVVWTPDGVAICAAADAQTSCQLAADGSGGAIVAWRDNRSGNTDIYAQRVNAIGAVQWTADGVVVCAAANIQYYPGLISDGSGGAFITWQDYRGGSFPDIYAQGVGASGETRWTTDGVAVCTARYSQVFPCIAPDGSGGLIIAWQDRRGGGYGELYAQRMNAIGAAQWTTDGVGICTAPNTQSNPTMTPDGSGGAIVAWQDRRTGTSDDIYAQRVDADGVVRWTTSGVAVCTAVYDQTNPRIVPDGSGGAIVTWQDYRGGISGDIYVQRVDASGVPQWTAGGVAVCTADSGQTNPEIVSDGSGGAIVTWQDYRGGSSSDIYARRVSAGGVALWPADGIALCTAGYSQTLPRIAPDGSGGAIVAWQDERGGSNNDIYAQRVDASGAAQWTADGVALSTADYSQLFPQIVPDGSGGAIITWEDHRASGYGDIYAQRVDASGGAQWTTDGVAICAAASDQESPQIVSDGSGGGIIAWQDYRSGTGYDMYAQRVSGSGAAQWATDGVAVSAAVYNQESPRITTDGAAGAIITWRDNRGGSYYHVYAQRVSASGGMRWTVNGADICTAPYGRENLQIVSDESGGAIVAWQDHRDAISTRIYAKRARESDLGPVCSVEPLVIDLAGTILVGGSRDTTFTIANLGVGLLAGSVSEACDQFGIVSGGSYALSNGQSQVVTVRFEPTAPGTFHCTIETGADICGDVSIAAVGVQLPPDSVIYVDADATGGGGGSSWTNAFMELADALALAPSCPNVTQIWVAEGTYRPTAGADRSATFRMRSGLGIYGGFAGTEGVRSERDVSAHVTILSGDIGTPGDASDNSFHVVTGSDTDSTAVIDGFTVAGGMAGGSTMDERMGAGFYSSAGSPTIANVEFRDNEAQEYGGGIWIANSNSKITNAIFRDNKSSYGGGVFSGSGPAPALANVLFVGNEASQGGGGIFIASSLSLVNASFFGNSAGSGGGGIYNSGGGATITNAIMWGDSAQSVSGHENCAEIFNIGAVTVSYTLVQGSGGSAGWDSELGTDGGGNIDADPLYFGASSGDLRILEDSPAIDAGDSGVFGLPSTDIAGDPRIQGASVDMGAYEGGIPVLFHSYARMDSLVDVPDDQGGWLRIYFTRSSYDDVLEEQYPIARYDVHRRVDDIGLLASIGGAGEVVAEALVAALPGGEEVSIAPPSSDGRSRYIRHANRYYLVNEAGAAAAAPPGTWEVIGNVSAQQQTQYIRLAPTLADSAAALTWSVFYISAHTTTPSVYFNSPPDSGYSVDNIVPGVPTGFVVAYGTGSGNRLSWNPCGDGDFQYFKVYRGSDRYFTPTPQNLAGATAGTEWTDPEYDSRDVHYKITALDHAGNESAPASPETATGTGDQAAPRAFALHQNAPNPFNPATVIRYDVPPTGGKVTLKVYDVSGRLVRTLVEGAQSAGLKSARWDGKNREGQSVTSGIYFCRMTAPGFAEQRKMVLLR